MDWKFLVLGDKIRRTKSARNNLEAIADKRLREMEEDFIAEERSLRYKTAPSAKTKLAKLQEDYPKRVQKVQERLAEELREKDALLTSYYIEVCALVRECNATRWPPGEYIGKIVAEVPTTLFTALTS